MREIRYRGKAWGKKIWIDGFYVRANDQHLIIPGGTHSLFEFTACDPSSISQFTGLYDEHGCQVYEGDIVILHGCPDVEARVVVYYEEAFNIATRKEYESLMQGSHPYMNDYAHMTCLNEWSNSGLVTVIGNIYDNPELLK